MPDLPTPIAKRLQRPSWRDARLLIGVGLVLLATTLGAKVVADADDRAPVYAARTSLKVGDALSAENLMRVDVQLSDAVAAYLSAASAVPQGTFALREVRPGELVPVTAVGGADAVGVQPVTLQADSVSVAALLVGSVVDVYVSPRDRTTTQETYGDPVLTLPAVPVSWLPSGDSRFGSASGSAAVQVLVPVAKVPQILAAVDQESRIALIPVSGSIRKSGS